MHNKHICTYKNLQSTDHLDHDLSEVSHFECNERYALLPIATLNLLGMEVTRDK
jgi:hypothetical protein